MHAARPARAPWRTRSATVRITASADWESATRTLDKAAAQEPYLLPPGPFTDQASWARVIRHARCADGSLDPDQWFPVSAEAGKARQEAAAAIAICTTCLVRARCLALSLRHWDIGQHGVWGGLVTAERAALRRRMHGNGVAASASHVSPTACIPE
jgi:Transcription factor WhiB